MVTSKEKTVQDYLATLSGERLEALTKLRAMCQKILRGFTEGMDYGMPCYKRGETIEVAFNSQKNYISLYLSPEILAEAKRTKLLTGLSCGKSCLRFTKPAAIDFELVEKLLTAVKKSPPGGTCE